VIGRLIFLLLITTTLNGCNMVEMKIPENCQVIASQSIERGKIMTLICDATEFMEEKK